jgi:MFS family permease
MRLGKFFKNHLASPKTFIFLTISIEAIAGGLLLPVLPYLVEQFRSDAFTIGLLTSSFAAAQFIATPVLGAVSDRIGRRPILLICTAGTSLAFYIFGFANALWLLFLSRIFNGLTGGVISTAQAYLADVSQSEQERTKNFGLIGAAAGLGFILGPALGGALAPINIKLPVFVAGTAALINTIIGYYQLTESLTHKIEKPIRINNLNPFTQLAELLRRNQVRNLLLGFFIYNFAFSGFTSIFVVFIRDRFDWEPAQAGSLLLVIGIVSIVVQGTLIGKIVPLFGEMTVSFTGLFLVSLALVLIALAPIGILLYGTQAIFALGVGLASPSLRGLLASSVAEQEQGKVSGASQSLVSLGQIIAPSIAGFSYDQLGMEVPFWGAALLVILAIVTIWPNRGAMKSASH